MPTLPGHICYAPGCAAKTSNVYCDKCRAKRDAETRKEDRFRNACQRIKVNS
jgi:hypothetical protein